MNQQTKPSIPNEAPGRNAPCPCGSGKKYKLCCCPPFLRKSSVDEAQQKPQVDEDAVIVCMPTRGSVSHETLTCLEMNTNGLVKGMIRCARKPVVEARNLLAKTALEVVANPSWPFTPREAFVLWLDDDAWMPPGLLDNMVKCLREPAMQQCDALFAWFSTRMPYSAPVAYRRLDDPESFPKIGVDCQHGDVVQVEMAGFHCVLMRPRLLERIGPNPFTPDPAYQEGEDWAFCRRAKHIGAKMAVGTSLPAIHVDPRDGVGYLPGEPALLMDGNELKRMDVQHMADGRMKSGEIRRYGLDAAEVAAKKADAETKRMLDAEMEQRRMVGAGRV